MLKPSPKSSSKVSGHISTDSTSVQVKSWVSQRKTQVFWDSIIKQNSISRLNLKSHLKLVTSQVLSQPESQVWRNLRLKPKSGLKPVRVSSSSLWGRVQVFESMIQVFKLWRLYPAAAFKSLRAVRPRVNHVSGRHLRSGSLGQDVPLSYPERFVLNFSISWSVLRS